MVIKRLVFDWEYYCDYCDDDDGGNNNDDEGEIDDDNDDDDDDDDGDDDERGRAVGCIFHTARVH